MGIWIDLMKRLQVSIVSLFFMMILAIPKNAAGKGNNESSLAGPHKEFVCEDCHETHEKKLTAAVSTMCISCHADQVGQDSHPIDVEYKGEPPEGLPLSKEGKVTCSTCHALHGKAPEEKLLRMKFDVLCSTCHFPEKGNSGEGGKNERDR